MEQQAPKAFRVLMALVLCLSMIPGLTMPETAYAGTYYSHGTISVTSPDATTTDAGRTIELEVGQQAAISVYPYQHVQYKGCCMDRCLTYGCDDMAGYVGTCFQEGIGCKCDQAPTLRQTVIDPTLVGDQVVSISGVSASSTLSASTANLGKMNTGTITLTATETGSAKLTVAASMEDCGMWNPSTVTYTVNVTDPNAGAGDDEEDASSITDSATITKGGTYTLAAGLANATITIDTTEPVEFIGNGIGGGAANYVTIDSTVPGANVTLNNVVMYTATDHPTNALRFTGANNTLTLKGQNQVQVCYNQGSDMALIRVPKDAGLTINGDGELYMLKHSYGAAGIGGDQGEACGSITLDGPSIYATGVNGGCIIGGDSTTQQSGKFSLNAGELAVHPANGQPALCGFSQVAINGGILSIVMGDSTSTNVAPAICSYDSKGAGTLVLNGGLVRMQPASNFDVASVDNDGNATKPLFIDPASIAGTADSYQISLDGKQVYSGDMIVSLHKGSVDDAFATNPNTWSKALSTEYYLLVTPESHTIDVNGKTLYVAYSESTGFVTSTEPITGLPDGEGSDDSEQGGTDEGDDALAEPELVDGVYQIATEAQLRWFADAASEDGALSAALVADIALQDGTLPIVAGAYSGTFDGQGHAITGITALSSDVLPGTTQSYAGLLVKLEGGVLRDLVLEGSAETDCYTGVFAGVASSGAIEGCVNRVDVTTSSLYVAGIAAQVQGTGATVDDCSLSIVGCRNEATVTNARASAAYAGGIVAQAAPGVGKCLTLEVSDCANSGAIEVPGKGYAGGVVAYFSYANIKASVSRCANTGSVRMGAPTTTSNIVGGVVGYSNIVIAIEDCFNAGDISLGAAKGYAGGVLGSGSSGKATISNAHSVGTVTGGGSRGAVVGYGANVVVENAYYLAGSCEGATLSYGEERSAEGMASLAAALDGGRGVWTQGEAYPVLTHETASGPDDPSLLVPAATISTSAVSLRHNGNGDEEPSWARVSLADADPEWAAAVTGIKVTSAADESYSVQVARADAAGTKPAGGLFSFNSDEAPTQISIGRNASNPVFVVNPGEGEPFEVAGMRGTTTYPQSQVYTVSIEAEGYEPVTADITFYTGASAGFTVWTVDEEGEDPVEMMTFSSNEIAELSSFANGSSQCGMTGFRTFSAVGVPVADLLDAYGIEYSEDDAFKLQTTDNFGSMFTYDQLFGERYFLQSVYDDPEVAEVYNRLASDASAGSDTELRRLLASKAKDAGTIARPMISANYAETMISGDQVGNTPVPTEENTFIDALTGAENQYRFTYGIALVQEDETVTFVTGDGATEVAPQKVKSHLMTSTENTTIKSTYWNNGIIIYKGQGSEPVKSDAADAIVKPADPTREGYEFAGWYTDEACTDGNEFDFEANDGTVDANTTLYAKWNEVEKTPELVDGVYQISNEEELAWFAEKSHEDNAIRGALTADIELSGGVLPYLGGTTATTGFTGSIDGQGHAITGIKSFANPKAPGLVPQLNGGTIKGLTLEGAVSSSGGYSMGAFVGTAANGGLIEGCTNRIDITCTSTSSNLGIGGIVGRSYNAMGTELRIVDCTNEGAITTAGQRAAGIVGDNTRYGTLVLERCQNEGAITSASGMAAGIIGESATSARILTISACSNAGAISSGGVYSYAAGILASAAVGTITVSDCYNAGDIVRSKDNGIVGGIVGNTNAAPRIEDCFSVGNVSNSANAESANVFAIAGGTKGVLANCYYPEGQSNPYEGAQAKATSDFLYLADDLGDPFVNDAVTGHPVFSWQDHEEPAPRPKTFAITYVLGAEDAVNAESNPVAYTEGDEVVFADPTREGFGFAGWFADEELTQQVAGITADQTGDVIVYAKWLDYGNLSIELSNGEQGYQYVATSMGRNPAAQVGFDLFASFDGADAESMSIDERIVRAQGWIDSITKVTIGEGDDAIELTNKALAEWMGEMSDPATDELHYYSLDAAGKKVVRNPETGKYETLVGSKVYVPIQLFGSEEYSTLRIVFTSEGYEDMVGEMVYRNIGADALTIRVKESMDSEASSVYTFTMDDLKSLPIKSEVGTSANCGMAGLRSFLSEGVSLVDVLSAAGIKFGPGMQIALRTTDSATTKDGNGGTEDAYISSGVFDYESLMGVDRYHYPAMWDDDTVYEELGNKTIYEVISQNMNAWKYGNDDTLKKLLATGAQKVESPIIAWTWNEGVVAWDGTNPATQTWGANTYNPYTSHETFRFLYGMMMDEDGSIANDNTTFSNTYGVFGIDLITNGLSAADETLKVTQVVLGLGAGDSLEAPFDSDAALLQVRLGGQVVLPNAVSADANTAFDGWYLDGKRIEVLSKETLAGYEGMVALSSKWIMRDEVKVETPGASDPAGPQIIYVQGPQGPTGATGARGPQGASGASAPAASVVEVAPTTAPDASASGAVADKSTALGERGAATGIDEDTTPLAEANEVASGFMWWDLWPLYLALLCAAGIIAFAIVFGRKKKEEESKH